MPEGPSDSLLQQYISCTDAVQADELLETLLVQHALPSIRTVVQRRFSFRGTAETQDIDDIASEVTIELIGRLRTMRDRADAGTIGGFAGYTAVAAYHGCHEYLRRKYPNRYRLKTRLRYLCNHEKRLAIWEDPNGGWLCGLRAWALQDIRPTHAEPDDARLAAIPRGSASGRPADSFISVLNRLGSPVELDRLVNIMAVIWGVADIPAVPVDSIEIRSGASDAGHQIDLRRWAAQLWTEIQELPHTQRSALLLNLRAGTSNSPALALLLLTGVTTVREIAVSLGMEAEQLASLWNRLPLDDQQIAAHLGITRQQVINARVRQGTVVPPSGETGKDGW